MVLFKKWEYIFTISIFLLSLSSSAPINRMDLFDKSGNNLLFVEFDYDSSGKNIGRTVYAADSTFLRKTTFSNDASGNRTREQSFNFNDDTTGYTLFSSQNGKSTINVFDQFGLNQFGASVSYVQNGTNSYDTYHNGSVICKFLYTYSPGGRDLDRIDVLDINNVILYYATFTSSARTIDHPRFDMVLQPSLKILGDRCHLTIPLKKESRIRVCVYNLSGKLVAIPFQENMMPESKMVWFNISLTNQRKLASNLYFIRLYIDGKITAYSQKFIANIGGIK